MMIENGDDRLIECVSKPIQPEPMSGEVAPEAIEDFITDLAAQHMTGEAIFNQYQSGNDPNNGIRRANLRRYLQDMAQRQPSTLLVLEAPGYRGSRLTGVPVTSRKVLLEGVPQLELFGEARGYQNVADAGFESVYGEQSATIVWGTLADLGQAPLIWNSFPFHPRQSGKPRSNRKPRRAETEIGSEYLRRMIALFQPRALTAVGNVAYDTLMGMGFNCAKVRHPAQGGKSAFVAGMTRLLG